MIPHSFRPVILCILDGLGVTAPTRGNAVTLAQLPVLNRLVGEYPTKTLLASGEAVGLPYGQMGNSEVGHLTIGLGKPLFQHFPRINKAILDKSFFTNPALMGAVDHLRQTNGTLHLIGLISNGGVHSSIDHLYALMKFANDQGVGHTAIHAILDGRDATFNSGENFLERLLERCRLYGNMTVTDVCGRFWAMDKDNRWDRIQEAYQAMVRGESSTQFHDALDAVRRSYNNGVYDEMFEPTVIANAQGTTMAMKDGDAVIIFNFRADRMRELTESLCSSITVPFARERHPRLYIVTMADIIPSGVDAVAFPPEPITTCLAQEVSSAGKKVLKIAETEKYAHVTYFINGMREEPYPGEDRILVPSPKIRSYDEQPQMSAMEIKDRVLNELKTDTYDLIVVNFANIDMVGHTGDLESAIQAIETVDRCLGEIIAAVDKNAGAIIITADHGNAEEMIDLKTGMRDTVHSTNPVPFIVVAEQGSSTFRPGFLSLETLDQIEPGGTLSDVAPTVLTLMGLPVPRDMKGISLV